MRKIFDPYPALVRAFDILASAAALLILSPLFALIATAIKLDDRGSAFFIQHRVGKSGKIFRMYKFRSMVTGAHRTDIFINGDQDSRITRVGKFLRRSALDELPQLINVFKGEMSIIGPRPALPVHIEEYSEHQMRRLEVKPGITGWAQINGRNSLSWPERIEHDIWYIDNRSLSLDLKVVLLTVPFLMKNEGVYAGREKFSFDAPEEKSEEATPVIINPPRESRIHPGRKSVVNQ